MFSERSSRTGQARRPTFINASTAAILLAALCIVSGSSAHAAVVYAYTGNNYESVYPPEGSSYTTSMSVSGRFETASLLRNFFGNATSLITEYSFFDGVNTLTDSNSVGLFQLETDGSGRVVNWNVEVSTPPDQRNEVGAIWYVIRTFKTFGPQIGEFDNGNTFECFEVGSGTCGGFRVLGYGEVDNNPGTWSVVPIPGALPLLGSALAGLGFIRWRRKGSA